MTCTGAHALFYSQGLDFLDKTTTTAGHEVHSYLGSSSDLNSAMLSSVSSLLPFLSYILVSFAAPLLSAS